MIDIISSLVSKIWLNFIPQKTSIYSNTVKLRKIVGWVKQSATQQSRENVGLPCGILLGSSNATCYPTGTLRANKSGNHKGAGLPQPTHFKVFGANPSVLLYIHNERV